MENEQSKIVVTVAQMPDSLLEYAKNNPITQKDLDEAAERINKGRQMPVHKGLLTRAKEYFLGK